MSAKTERTGKPPTGKPDQILALDPPSSESGESPCEEGRGERSEEASGEINSREEASGEINAESSAPTTGGQSGGQR